MEDNPRATFIVAQQLIAEGRLDEARLLLRSIEDIPEAADWAQRIEQGLPIAPDEVTWEPNTAAPGLPEIILPAFNLRRFVVSIFLALTLFAPIFQMLMISGPVYPSREIANQTEARARVQYLCNVLVDRAIAEKRLENEFGSCLDWSLKLSNGQMREIVRCHLNAGDDFPAFQTCIANEHLFPPDVMNPGQAL
jgi:hypothetical protein